MSSLLAGLAYVAIGRFFPNPATDPFWWRLGAWALSAIILATQLVYEHRQGRLPPDTGRRVASGAAIGGFGLALSAMLFAWHRSGGIGKTWPIALVVWPLFLAVPSFIVAYVGATLLRRYRDHRLTPCGEQYVSR